MALGLWPSLALLRVLVLGIFAPTEVAVSDGGPEITVRAQGDALSVDGGAALPRWRLGGTAGFTVRLRHREKELRRHYPGALELSARAGHLVLVNEVGSEDYVARVVAAEGADTAGAPAAAQALAVVVRSFAAHAGAAPRHPQAQLCDLTHCQVYQGDDRRAPFATEAARITAGQVLSIGGQPAEVYFTAACGGHTAAVAEVWPGALRAPRPHLGGQPCPEPAAAPWQVRLSRADLTQALRAARLVPPDCDVRAVRMRSRGVGGWGGQVALRCGPAPAPERVLGAEALRMAVGRRLGWSRLPSSNFALSDGGAEVLSFQGRGSGHGVGLCLAGAAARGQAGDSAEHILRRYFPGASLVTAP